MEGPKFGGETTTANIERYEALSERDKNLLAAQEALAPEYMARMSLQKILEWMQGSGYTFLGSKSRKRDIN